MHAKQGVGHPRKPCSAEGVSPIVYSYKRGDEGTDSGLSTRNRARMASSACVQSAGTNEVSGITRSVARTDEVGETGSVFVDRVSHHTQVAWRTDLEAEFRSASNVAKRVLVDEDESSSVTALY